MKTMIKEVRYDEAHDVSWKDVAPEPSWDPRFRVGDDVVRTMGGGDSYNRGEVVEVVEEKRYRVDYGLGFPTLIREENLEPFDVRDPFSEPPRSFVPPILPPFTQSERSTANG